MSKIFSLLPHTLLGYVSSRIRGVSVSDTGATPILFLFSCIRASQYIYIYIYIYKIFLVHNLREKIVQFFLHY